MYRNMCIGVESSKHENVIFVPPSMLTTNLFIKIKSAKPHLAVVLDEYVGTDGTATTTSIGITKAQPTAMSQYTQSGTPQSPYTVLIPLPPTEAPP
ncbi:hypothetical protein X798_05992 [Onchocerca flexuosa]|uniref:Uncharacterized protein n=1 Tax=Onchocerca flexuosa TaxID=387005 RepID=A0A238BQ80_9BILA|nr:hypothetical protein X798_05992 [Onchocerca flexuosa]